MCFQLFKLAFDEEVSREKVEELSAAIRELRWPETVDELFAVNRARDTVADPAERDQDPAANKKKYHTLR